jgi:predicted SprT family Zn-dependent metalloprotease
MDLSDVRRLARELMDQHGLTGWQLVLDRAKQRAGVCRYDRRTIGLSGPLMRLYDEEQVRETVLHEIAHALVGPGAGHGPQWWAMAQRLGSTGERCISAEAPWVAGAWVGTCQAGHAVAMHRRPRRVRSCTVCHPRVLRGAPHPALASPWRASVDAPRLPQGAADAARRRAAPPAPLGGREALRAARVGTRRCPRAPASPPVRRPAATGSRGSPHRSHAGPPPRPPRGVPRRTGSRGRAAGRGRRSG